MNKLNVIAIAKFLYKKKRVYRVSVVDLKIY